MASSSLEGFPKTGTLTRSVSSSRWNNTTNILRVLMAALAVAFLAVIAFSLRDTSVKEGDKAPAFSIVTDSGKRITPESFGGKVLVLNFWATWCTPCVEEVPSLNEMQKRFAKSGVVVLAVSIDKNEQKYRAFLKRIPVAFQTTRDSKAQLSARYGTFQYPESYIIKNGRVMRKFPNAEDWLSDDIDGETLEGTASAGEELAA